MHSIQAKEQVAQCCKCIFLNDRLWIVKDGLLKTPKRTLMRSFSDLHWYKYCLSALQLPTLTGLASKAAIPLKLNLTCPWVFELKVLPVQHQFPTSAAAAILVARSGHLYSLSSRGVPEQKKHVFSKSSSYGFSFRFLYYHSFKVLKYF